ncbi:phage tail protein [Halomonas campisalis]|uniref:Phage tail protein n=1 Tax=Billgrantia campisalis TaxID=74661 RepID=A0ABS9PDB9_9GAMM|nr:tail fiber protein [Halomonas campisalis]MCG6659765.1 phage tail protein [Halomonas campisalis]MDR5864922.1 tail fiber protein [Halomonas campisalis]
MPTPKLPLAALATVAGLLMASPSAMACNDQPYIGSICATAATFCPIGYEQANGQTLAIAQNQALFALIGTTYGGNGQTTFALPDLQGRSLVGTGQSPGYSSVTLGQQRGQEEVTLTQAQMPQHTHGAHYSPGDFSGKIVATTSEDGHKTPASDRRLGSVGGGRENTLYSDSNDNLVEMPGMAISQQGAEVTVDAAGGSQPFNNLPPQLGINYCIAVQGIFPQRD